MAPFMKKDENGKSSANLIRIAEGIVISVGAAGIIALFAYLWMIPTIKQEIQTINQNICKIEALGANHETRIRDIEVKVAVLEAKESH